MGAELIEQDVTRILSTYGLITAERMLGNYHLKLQQYFELLGEDRQIN